MRHFTVTPQTVHEESTISRNLISRSSEQHKVAPHTFRSCVRRGNVVHEVREILFAVFHAHEDGVQAATNNHIDHSDDIPVLKAFENRYFPQTRQGKSVRLVFHADLLQGHNFPRPRVLGPVNDSIGAFSDAVELLELVHRSAGA